MEVAEGVAACEPRGQCDGLTAVRRVEEEVVAAVAGDAPAAVVELHVVEAAQQDAAVDIGAAAFGVWVDVVCLAIGRGAVAADPAASTVADGESEALLRRVEASLPA